jgi:hypothetical protein
MRSRRFVCLSAIAATVALTGSALTALASAGGAPNASPVPDSASTVTAASELFAVLREPRDTDDALARESYAAFAEDPIYEELGVDWNSAREVTTARGYRLIAVPARSHVCLLAMHSTIGSGLVCATVEGAAQSGVMIRTTIADNGDTMVTGLLPDGVSNASVPGAAQDAVTADGNGLVAFLPAGFGAAQLQWQGASGARSAALPPDPGTRGAFG